MSGTPSRHDRYNRSEKGRARYRRYNAKRTARPDNARRVWVGEIYVGMAPDAGIAHHLNEDAKARFHDR